MIVHVEKIGHSSSTTTTTAKWPPLPECVALDAEQGRQKQSPRKFGKKIANIFKKTFLSKKDCYPIGRIEQQLEEMCAAHEHAYSAARQQLKNHHRRAQCIDDCIFVNSEIDKPIRALTAASVASVTRRDVTYCAEDDSAVSTLPDGVLKYATIRRTYSLRYKGFGKRCY